MPTTPNFDILGFDILGFGAVAIDDLLYVDEYPAAESKVRVRRRIRQCGGLTGTALVAAARLGARCAYVGVLGNDPPSEFVVETFSREGIDTSHCVRRDDASPAHSTIIVGRNGNTRTIFASVDGAIGADPTGPSEELIRAARVLLIDHHGLEGSIRAARIARAAGVAVVADLERDPGGPFAKLIETVDHLVLSARFAGELTGEDDPARAAKALMTPGRQAVVVTCGSAGGWYIGEPSGDVAKKFPAFPVKVADTTGCGDVFHGSYAHSLSRGDRLDDRVLLASAAAAIKATRRGGQSGCPTAAEVAQFLQKARAL